MKPEVSGSQGRSETDETEEVVASDKSKPAKVPRHHPPVKLNQKVLEKPLNSYEILCFTQQLADGSVALYFRTANRNASPYLVTFRSVFQDGLEDKLYVTAIGIRCTDGGTAMPSREGQNKQQAERFGWPVFVSDMVEDANMYAFHVCNTLNASKEYIGAFDVSRTSNRKPFFIVTKNMTASPARKWDQVMWQKDVVKHVCNKFNLRDMQARMQYTTEGRWETMFEHFFTNTEAAKEAIETFLAGEEEARFTP